MSEPTSERREVTWPLVSSLARAFWKSRTGEDGEPPLMVKLTVLAALTGVGSFCIFGFTQV